MKNWLTLCLTPFFITKLTDSFVIKKGVRQGDIQSALLFNIAMQAAQRNIKGWDNIRKYADFLTIMARTF